MAQTAIRLVKENARDAAFAGFYSDLEPDIHDLRLAARLAQKLVCAVGQLQHKDGECVEVPDAEELALALFAVCQVADMTKAFEAEYHRRFESVRPL